ncbi:threonine aldolase [Mesorhizobium sp. B2-4-15]|uniref:threonine aldolase family protein n=1 Tax=Mesorhizobium sp. B2-4-15 TaxID=2589934 RepID=UPI0011536718|nr:GntG family PLP-dependent aldolase [Mesorhizobium sp. B2-4-15]TPK62407.1 threonine aldolase [Mesorhizobium sp. B2-4-15]
MIDLRSDTITIPTAEMIEAMSRAELGDDFFRDDPTVLDFEAQVADLLGTEAAMLVISGTMGNIVSAMALAPRGTSIIVEASAHIHINESGWPSTIAGLTPRPIQGTAGMISVPALTEAIAAGQSRLSTPPSLLCLENTHNAAGGRVMASSDLAALADIAHSNGLKVHLDGARIFNAAVALGRPVTEFARHVDTITFCLCKGLSCPLGAVVAGSSEIIQRARRWRQVLGGGMRQAGVIAAAGRIALRSMIARLEEDHQNAKLMATRLRDAGLDVDPCVVDTNIVFVTLPSNNFDPTFLQAELSKNGVRISPPKAGRMRLVTHRQISQADALSSCDLIVRACEMAVGRQPSSEKNHVGGEAVY